MHGMLLSASQYMNIKRMSGGYVRARVNAWTYLRLNMNN